MKEVLSDFVKSTAGAFLTVGVLLMLAAGASHIKVAGLDYQAGGGVLKPLLVATGLTFCTIGAYLLVSEHRTQARHPLYTYAGLKEDGRNDENFQDFNLTRPGNINVIYHLWADARGGQISAFLQPAPTVGLRVRFCNPAGTYPANVAVRPIADRALNIDRAHRLKFEARSAPEDPSDLNVVWIGVRIGNQDLQYWEYADRPNEYRMLRVDNDWASYEIDLHDTKHWYLATFDGNYLDGPEKPSFKAIATVVFEVGSEGQRAGPGTGTVEIQRIRVE